MPVPIGLSLPTHGTRDSPPWFASRVLVDGEDFWWRLDLVIQEARQASTTDGRQHLGLPEEVVDSRQLLTDTSKTYLLSRTLLLLFLL
jgi:hypothetical protein